MIWMPPIGPGNPIRSAGRAYKAPGAEILKPEENRQKPKGYTFGILAPAYRGPGLM